VLAKVEAVIRFMALFTVATGVIVLIGAMQAGKFQRIRETVLLRTLGASQRQLMHIQLVEYAVLGALAALTGVALAVAANVVLARYVFSAPAVMPLGTLIGTAGAVTLLTLLTGWLAGRGVARHPPLEVLRAET
jgi:putative ABC transport system permease protein